MKKLGGEKKKKMNTKMKQIAFPMVVVIAVLLAFSSPAAAEGIGGYAGNHPLTIYEHGTINGGLVFETVTDGSKYTKLNATEDPMSGDFKETLTQEITIRSCVDAQDTNCIPPGATVKMARLYNYYCWSTSDKDRGNAYDADHPEYVTGVPAEAYMWFNNGTTEVEKVCVHGYKDTERYSVPNPINYGNDVIHYWDTKGQDYWGKLFDYPSGEFAWDVTDMVTGSGTYVAKIKNMDSTPTGYRPGQAYPGPNRERFVPFGFGLVVVYEHTDSPQIKYWIAEGCDYIMARCIGPETCETPENATTSATFFGGVSNATYANLTTVWTHSESGFLTPPMNMMCFNCPTSCSYCLDTGDPSDCCIGPSTAVSDKAIGLNYFDVKAKISSGENLLEFQDRDDDSCVHNAFLVVEGGEEVIPISANVTFDKKKLNLNSNGILKAFITLPEPYDVANINVSTVNCTCEDCEEAKAFVGGGVIPGQEAFEAKFKIQELNMSKGEAVLLTVTGNLTTGETFAGSNTVEVV